MNNNVITNFFDKFEVSNKEIAKNVVYISSKIYVSNVPFNYINTRSIFTPDERFEQTVKTIESIRKYIPNSYIILFDNSKFIDQKLPLLSNMVDLFINITDDELINYYTDENVTKWKSVIVQMQTTLNYLKTNMIDLKINQFFNISGRYTINETFNYDYYDNEDNIFKKNNSVSDRLYYYTSFFKISSSKFAKFCEIIQELYNDMSIGDQYGNTDLEVLLPLRLNFDFLRSENLGITQNIAVWHQTDMI